MSRDAFRLAASNAGHAAIELHHVARRLGSAWVLRGACMRVAPGEMVAIVGTNGCGKTTLLRIVATLLLPTRGAAKVFGHDVRSGADAARANIGFLGHGSGVYDDLTGEENLAFAQRMSGRVPDRHVVARALETVGLADAADRRVRSYSSGMQRRLGLARLFLHRPRLLLLDEPYNSLDADGAVLVDELLTATAAAGGAGLVVLHDLARSGIRFHRVLELRDGALHDRSEQFPRVAAGGI